MATPNGNKAWTISQEREFKKEYPQANKEYLIKKYGRSWISLKSKARRIGAVRNLDQSYSVKVIDSEGNQIYHTEIPRGNAAKSTLKVVLNRISLLNARAIDRGEWILSITHNLECYEP